MLFMQTLIVLMPVTQDEIFTKLETVLSNFEIFYQVLNYIRLCMLEKGFCIHHRK